MSKPSAKTSHKTGTGRPKVRAVTPDRTYYIGLAVIGVFAVFLIYVLTEGSFWWEPVAAYLAIVAFQVNLQAIRVYHGKVPKAGWQRALARLPLRCVGYGNAGAHPIEAAHGDRKVRNVIIASIVFSFAVLAVFILWIWWSIYR
jgi:hypothetical protein